MAEDGYRRRQLPHGFQGTENGFCQKIVWRYNAPGVEKQWYMIAVA